MTDETTAGEFLTYDSQGNLVANFASHVKKFPLPDEGLYRVKIEDASIGENKDKDALKIAITAKILDEGEFKGSLLFRDLSLKASASYYTMEALSAIVGQDLEQDGVNLSQIVGDLPGYECHAVVVHNAHKGKVYANIDSFLPLTTGESGVGQTPSPDALDTFRQQQSQQKDFSL